MEKKMETTILGYIGVVAGLYGGYIMVTVFSCLILTAQSAPESTPEHARTLCMPE